MKTGIMTFHKTCNYGACLQSVALVRKINDLGYDAEIVDYKCENVAKREIPLPLICKKTVLSPKYFLYNFARRKKYKYLERFRKRFGKYSERSYDRNDIAEANGVYDKFLSGSDIVWELDVTGGDTAYFLDFAEGDERLFSFSSSFGYEAIPNKYYETTKALLSRYTLLSTREKSGAKTIRDLIGRSVPVTLDPTLCLTADEWALYEEKMSIKGNYVLLYFDDGEHKALEFAKKLAEENNMKVVYLCDFFKKVKSVKTLRNVSVGQFLYLIRNAGYVVTGSYHGVVFSINFNTPFFYVNRAHYGRIKTITETFGITGKDILSPDGADPNFDWDAINEKLSTERSISETYLKAILER